MQVVEGGAKLVQGTCSSKKSSLLFLAIGSKVNVSNIDDDKKTKDNILTYGVIVNVVRAIVYGCIIEEVNMSISITSIVPG